MKKLILGLLVLVSTISGISAATLKDKTILYAAGSYLAGQPIPLGVDSYGYNYNAHAFNGNFFDSYANSAGLPPYSGDDTAYLLANPTAATHWAWPYRTTQLAMKWNEAWLSSQDRDNDGKLDRHFGLPSYIGSGAWISNKQSDEYTAIGGSEETWNYMVKIVAVPASAVETLGTWFDTSGTEIGPSIWGEFATVQGVYNDSGTGEHGCYYRSPAGAGVGQY